jgi:hypothetical protein
MRAERRGGGLRQRATDTRPYTERTLSVTTKFSALHSVGVLVALGPARKRPAFRGSGRRESMGVYAHPIGDDSNWEPDGVTLQVRFCEEPGTNCRMAEILWHRRETRRQTEKTNFGLSGSKNPAYSPNPFLSFQEQLCASFQRGP